METLEKSIGMKKVLRFVVFHVACFIAGTALFILVFRAPVITHVVFFYRGVVLLGATTVFIVCVLAGWKHWSNTALYTIRDILVAGVVLFCINLVVFTHLPVTADRSMTVFFLGYMAKHDRAFTSDQLRQAFVETYVNRNNALEKRFHEQEQSGTIEQIGDTFTITKRGMLLMRLYGWAATLFGVDKKNLSL
ncbi:hypothetical protein A3A63_00510 [Candidatus Gottesmanbacteria bacterium RIFCSPLOWO2_01_FULL_46_9]|uniref:Uncharacterized protein n=1 Tax=Candidatus Gottesmanbacteria bacterium RIFCSPLOWO2_01_FULL_46_9 TaxID=1798394 RepID=A0A1F6B323_9BACT|nr:MAG: hypothetical protein A3A63_00510 [Candidatus Gottesmanbacteria bacterium RIFCSPLOWO2_01_FULL_46_9]